MDDAADLRGLAKGDVERLTLLTRVSRAINASYNVEDALSAAMDVVVQTLGVSRGCIMLGTGEPASRRQIFVARGIDARSWALNAFEYSRTIVERVWSTGQSVLCNDAMSDRQLSKIESLRRLKTRSLMCVPMQVRGKTHGVLYVDNAMRANLFTPTDLQLLEVIADLAAAAIERAHYYVDLNLSAAGLESLGRHARGIAHDFNNLVFIINAHRQTASMHAAHGDLGKIEQSLERIQVACSHAHVLTRHLLSYAERSPLGIECLDVNRVLVGLQPVLESALGSEHELLVRTCAERCPVEANPMEIEQIAFNLVMNARNSMPQGGRVTLRTEREAARVRMSVCDCGVGMDEETADRLCSGSPGSVGLSIVHEILRLRRGGMRIESSPGQGSRFDVYLPLVSPESDDEAEQA